MRQIVVSPCYYQNLIISTLFLWDIQQWKTWYIGKNPWEVSSTAVWYFVLEFSLCPESTKHYVGNIQHTCFLSFVTETTHRCRWGNETRNIVEHQKFYQDETYFSVYYYLMMPIAAKKLLRKNDLCRLFFTQIKRILVDENHICDWQRDE